MGKRQIKFKKNYPLTRMTLDIAMIFISKWTTFNHILFNFNLYFPYYSIWYMYVLIYNWYYS